MLNDPNIKTAKRLLEQTSDEYSTSAAFDEVYAGDPDTTSETFPVEDIVELARIGAGLIMTAYRKALEDVRGRVVG